MSQPKLQRHGEQVKPYYAPAPGKSEGRAGTSTDETRTDGELSGVVRRFSKRQSASNTPITMGWMKGSYAQAIEFTGSPQGLRGMLLLWGLLGAGIVLWPTLISFTVTDWELRNILTFQKALS